MQALQSQIEEEQSSAVHIRERAAEELQNIVSRDLPLFYRRAYRYLGNSHDAEDAVQDALLSAYKHLDQFKGSAKMTTWLTSIVINSALTKLRRRPRQPHSSLDEPLAQGQNNSVSDSLADLKPSPEVECARSELHGYLMRLVSELPPILQNAIQLHYLDGLTTAEIANILGAPEGTIKARVSRARTQLKRFAKLDLKRTSAIAGMQNFVAFRPGTN
jgi:RNA polymerase sigma-70 factor (ECF subfamily)